MSLLDDVSIVVTPNGYKAGTLYGVLPTYTEGSDEVNNGDFATDLSGWNITGTDATHTVTWTASGARFQSDTTSPVMEFKQLNLLTSGKQYVLTCNIAYTGVGQLRVNVGTNLTPFTEGANTKYFTATSSTMSFLRENANVDAIIDNVIVKEVTRSDMDVTRATAATRVDEDGLVNYAEIIGSELVTCGDFSCATPSTYWTATNAVISFDNNQLTVDDTAGAGGDSRGSQTITTENGKTYRLTFDRISTTSLFYLGVGSGAGYNNIFYSSLGTDTGEYTLEFTATSSSTTIAFISGGNGITVFSSISVKEVTRDNVPRIDYTGGGCPHILAEPMRTNEVTYSEDFTDSSWVKTNVDVSNNTELAPNGTETATRAIISSTGTDLRTQCNVIESTNYTFTFYAKKGTSTDITYRVYDVSNGSNIVSPTNYFSQVGIDWQRVELNFTTPSGCTSVLVYLSSDSAVVGDIYLWGVQLEKSYATSYIPTSGSTVTRNKDIFTRDGIGSLINSTEGVLFLEVAALSDDISQQIGLYGSSSTKQLRLEISNTTIRAQLFDGAYQANMSSTQTVTNFNKIAFKWKVNDFALWINGVEVDTDNSGTTFSANDLDRLHFSAQNGSSSAAQAKVKQLQVYNTALTDEQLLQLTGTSGTDFYESYAEMASALTYTIQ